MMALVAKEPGVGARLPLFRFFAEGRWLAALAQSSCLMLCGLPVLAACMTRGGVHRENFALAALSTAALLLLVGAVDRRRRDGP